MLTEKVPTPRARGVGRGSDAEAVRETTPDGLGAPVAGGKAEAKALGCEGGAAREGVEGVGLAVGTAALTPRIARGDRAAMGAFYEAWFDRCYAMARSLTRRDEAFCLDVVQDAMLRVVRRVPPMASDADLARWMVRVVHTCAIDLIRREARRRRRERVAARAEQFVPWLPSDGASERDRWLIGAMETLDEQERALLRLRIGGGATLEKAGDVVGVGGDVAHGRIRRVLARLRRLGGGGV